MTREYQSVPYPIMGGMDTKISGVVLPAPKLQRADNVYSDQTGSLRRRFGRLAINSNDQTTTAITGWTALSTFQDRLVGWAANNGMYEYSPTDSRWTYRGLSPSWRQTTMPVTAPTAASPVLATGVSSADVAVTTTGWKLYAYDLYETVGANVKSTTYVTLFDAAGGRYKSDFQLATVTGGARVSSAVRVVMHANKFYVIYSLVSTPATLKCFIVDPTSAATLVTSFAAAAATISTTLVNLAFDAEDNATYGPFVAYADTAGSFTIKFGFLNSGGTLISTSTTSTGAVDAARVAVDVEPAKAMHGIAYLKGTVPDDVFACLRSWSGAAWTATATSAATMTGITSVGIRHLTCKFDLNQSVPTLRMVFDGDNNVTLPCVRHSTYNTLGFIVDGISGTGMLPNSYVASKPFTTNMGNCYWAANSGGQSTLFLMLINGTTDAAVIGVADQGSHATITSAGVQVPRVDTNLSPCCMPSFSFVTRSQLVPGSAFKVFGGTIAMHEVAIDTTHPENRVCVEDGASLFVPSAQLGYFDGKSVVEVGFLQYVDTVVLTPSNGAGALDVASDYYYRVIPEWINAQGEREIGTDAGPFKVTMGGADDTVTLTINTLPWTLKKTFTANSGMVSRNNLAFGIYRTVGNPASGDDPHYRVGVVVNDAAADTVSFVDLLSDGAAQLKEQLYADTELSNVAPPPGYILSAGNGRLFVGGIPDDPSLIVYSKTRGHGVPASFSSVLQIQMPVSAGSITSTAVLDEQVVVFTSSNVFRVVGDGLNDTGTGAGYANPVVVISADGGAVNHRSTSATTIGIVYQSTRGIMLLDAGLSGNYIGAPLEGLLTAGGIMGIITQPNLQLIHCVEASTSYVFDYLHKQWYQWTHGSSGPPVLWSDELTAIQDDLPHVGSRTEWTDGSRTYAASVVLGWEKGSTMQSDIDFRRIAVTGASLAAHYFDIQLAYDYNATTVHTSDVTIAGAAVLRQRVRVGRQKANSLQVTITDAILDAYGTPVVQATAGWRLNEVIFEVKVRGNLSHRRIS